VAILFWIAGLALSGPILSSPYFPSEDGSAYLYWTSVFRGLADPTGPLAAVFERNIHWNTPNLAYFALQYGASAWLEPHLGQRLLVLLLLVWWVGSIHLLSLAAPGRLTLGSFAALLLFHNWALYMGFFTFLFGIPCFVCGIAVLIRLLDPGPQPTWRYALVGGLAVLAYYLHLVAGALLGGGVVLAAILVMRRSPARSGGLLLAAGPVLLLLVGYVVAGPFGGGGLGWAVRSTLKRFVGFAFWRGFAVPDLGFWLTLALFACTCVVLCLYGLRAWRRNELPPGSRFVMVLSAWLVLLYFAAPVKVGIGSFLNDRILLALWAVLLPVLGAGLSRRAGVTIGLAIGVLLGWQVLDFSLRARRFGLEFGRLMQTAAEAIPAGSTIDYVQPYEESRFENSFVAPFMDGGEIAYHCHCILVNNYWQNSPFYWVRTRPGQPRQVDLRVSIDGPPGGPGTGVDSTTPSGQSREQLRLRLEPAPNRP
jgi:hypothetical protein